MALLRDAILKAGPSLRELLQREKNQLNLKVVNKVTIRFDPFRDVKHIRQFAYIIHDKHVTTAHPRLLIKTEILSDRSEETITFDLADGKQFLFKCGNLKVLEIFKLINKHITPLSPVEEKVEAPIKGKAIGKGKRK